MSLRQYVEALLGLLYPSERFCISCKEPLPEAVIGLKKWESTENVEWLEETILCEKCQAELQPLQPPYCQLCGRHLEDFEFSHRCPECIRETPFMLSRSYGEYTGVLRDLLHRFKFSKEQELIEILGPLMHEAWNLHMAHFPIDMVVPVPAHPERLKERGYNQAELLAKTLADYTKIPFVPILERHLHLSGQASRSRHERLHALEDSYRVVPNVISPTLKGKRILLIDDIYTTGSTAEACTRALKESGVESVYVLTLAR